MLLFLDIKPDRCLESPHTTNFWKATGILELPSSTWIFAMTYYENKQFYSNMDDTSLWTTLFTCKGFFLCFTC